MVLNQKRVDSDIFYDEGHETVEHVYQRAVRSPIPGNIQGWGSEKPDQVENVPAHCSGGWTR